MPGPAPVYRPVFPPAFLEQAERVVHQRTIAFQLRQRAHRVLLCHHQPLVSQTAAAAPVQLHANSVRLWRQRWARGDCVLEDNAGRGRTPLFSPSG
jgi:hypothetical protein